MSNEKYLKLTKAKVGIILDHPFFATLMMRKNFVENNSIPTACTDGKTIEYNREFFDSLSSAELQGLICHELLHSSLLHHVRREGRDLETWNEACDYALNPILLDAGMQLPKGALVSSEYSGRSAEEIFKILGGRKKEDKDGEPEDGDGDGDGENEQQGGFSAPGMGDVKDAPAKTKSEMEEIEAQTKIENAQAQQMAKQCGKMPGMLQRMIDEVMQPKQNWHEILARFLSEIAHNDYSFSKPNPRYLSSGFILPSLYNLEVGEIVLMVDTSGSIDNDLLNKFAAEMQDVVADFKTPITVLYIDTEVAGTQIIEPDDTFILEPKGGGGTDFRPGFEWLAEQGIEPKAVVYFTDMECYSFPDEPTFPVLWARTGGNGSDAPFGEVIDIDLD